MRTTLLTPSSSYSSNSYAKHRLRLHQLRSCCCGTRIHRLGWIVRNAMADGDENESDRSSSSSFSSSWPSNRQDEASSSSFCIIEGPQTVQDFAQMQIQEIRDNIKSRRNKIFLLMEEVRRLRIQQRIKNSEMGLHEEKEVEEEEENEYSSSIPFFPPLTLATLKMYYAVCFGMIAAIVMFGGLLAPTLELKLGIGGSSYKDFIKMLHLPLQLSDVDPIVASFSGGAVGVISALMVVEINNVKLQDHKRCKYCVGTGYLACGRCCGTGWLLVIERETKRGDGRLTPAATKRCPNCSGAAKVMCPTCLCTGMALASEHDPRIDPFD